MGKIRFYFLLLKGADSKKTKMGSNNNQGLIHVIKAINEVNYYGSPAWFDH
jgi:hypothetical protein